MSVPFIGVRQQYSDHYDRQHVGAWVMDFAKILSLPDGVAVGHGTPHRQLLQQGNHEEGWLTRVTITLFG